MEQVRWGIIGCGRVTERKSGPALQQARGSSLVAVMRRQGEKARDYARRHGVPRWYDDAYALLQDPEVDAVYVATPPDSHAHYVRAAAAAGKPVYVEKPMARNAREGAAMLAACESAGVPLFVAYYRRCWPLVRQLREWLDQERIGPLRTVSLQRIQPAMEGGDPLPWRVIPEISGGGLFYDVGSHQLDLLDFLLGPILGARGTATNQLHGYPAEDTVAACLEFADGVLGTGLWCFAAGDDPRRDRLEIIGAAGRIVCEPLAGRVLELHTPAGRERREFVPPDPAQLPLVQTVVDELRGLGTCPSTGTSALRTQRVMDRLVAPYYGKTAGSAAEDGPG